MTVELLEPAIEYLTPLVNQLVVQTPSENRGKGGGGRESRGNPAAPAVGQGTVPGSSGLHFKERNLNS